MIPSIKSLVIVSSLFLAGCTAVYDSNITNEISAPVTAVESKPLSNIQKKPTKAAKVQYAKKTPKHVHYDKVGLASWYGPGFHGRKTANGEKFNQDALTAAHPFLPFASKVWVENVQTGKRVLVKINDRGPFVPGRMIDLSKGAAQALGGVGQGVFKVRVVYDSEETDKYRNKVAIAQR